MNELYSKCLSGNGQRIQREALSMEPESMTQHRGKPLSPKFPLFVTIITIRNARQCGSFEAGDKWVKITSDKRITKLWENLLQVWKKKLLLSIAFDQGAWNRGDRFDNIADLQERETRSRHLPLSWEVFLLLVLTPQPPKSFRRQTIKTPLKHHWYCQKEGSRREEKRRPHIKMQGRRGSGKLRINVDLIGRVRVAVESRWELSYGGGRKENIKC